MAYSQGGLIAASDYNGFVNGSNQLNTVWSTGTGNAGYGQTAISAVSGSGLVTATQWASLINTLNSVLTHQSGSGSGISGSITSGQTINYLSTLSTNVNTAYTNRSNFASQGSTTTGSVFSPNFTAVNGATAQTYTITRTATFSSGDAARYFFNAGGQLNFIFTSTTVGDGTARSTDLQTLISTNLVSYPAFRSATGGGRSGTGGTVNTNATNIGYYQLTTTNQTLTQITSTTSGYTGDYVILAVKSNGVQGAHADVGSVITFTVTIYSAARTDPTLGAQFNDSINITPNHRIDVVYPETTNLTNTWGTVTIA